MNKTSKQAIHTSTINTHKTHKTSLISLENIHKDYELGNTTIHALRGLNLEIEEGKFVSLIGPSGCGKTTALNLIGCIDRPNKGNIHIEGNNVLAMEDKELTMYRGANIGFIFQNFNLIKVMSVKENISYPLMIRGGKHKISQKEIEARSNYIIDAVGLGEWQSHRPNELSGGQRQRVAIARALVVHPKLVIADEPTANLDSKTSLAIMELMSELQKELKTTFVFATHDFRFIDYVDIIYEIKDGVIIGTKSKEELKERH